MPYDVNDFEQEVIQRSHNIPVLTDFWAEWCSPCKILGPILERLAQQNNDEWALAKVNTDAHQMVARKYSVKSIPNVKLFVDGLVTDEFMGALPENDVREWIRKALPGKYGAEIERAKEYLSQNQLPEAAEILDKVLAEEPNNDETVVLLARAVLCSDTKRAVQIVGGVQLGSQYFEIAQAIITISSLLEHLEGTEALPNDLVKSKYIDSIGYIRSTNFSSAIQGFLDVIRRNRYYDQDGARRACIAIFAIMGDDHEITREYRPKFSQVLF